MASSKTLCIWHGNCQDGFGAAWSVRHALGDEVEFYPGIYQDAPPDVTGRDVLLVDFSYKRPVIEAMAGAAHSVLILDHHKSAAEDLAGLEPPPDVHPVPTNKYQPDTWRTWADFWKVPRLFAVFDMERSGAGLAWDYLHPGVARPRLINHIEDRDLWRFKIPYTREIAAAVFSYPYDFGLWDTLMADEGLARLEIEGRAIERKHHQDIANTLPVVRREMVIGGHLVPVANLPLTMTSDAGHALCECYDRGLAGSYVPPFAACYWDTAEGRVFSLRSTEGGKDVSAIAKGYGGGGHARAAGFRMPLGWEGDGAPPRRVGGKISTESH